MVARFFGYKKEKEEEEKQKLDVARKCTHTHVSHLFEPLSINLIYLVHF